MENTCSNRKDQQWTDSYLTESNGTNSPCGIATYTRQSVDQYVQLTGKFAFAFVDNLRKNSRISPSFPLLVCLPIGHIYVNSWHDCSNQDLKQFNGEVTKPSFRIYPPSTWEHPRKEHESEHRETNIGTRTSSEASASDLRLGHCWKMKGEET